MTIRLDGQSLSIMDLVRVARENISVEVDPASLVGLAASREAVERVMARDDAVYGINTGFGKLANVRIGRDDLGQLQLNLIRSHAAGVGPLLPSEIVRAMMVLRANVLLRPTSGVRPELVHALVALLNSGLIPAVPSQGSVGASGDLAPLSHLALVLMGEGEVVGADGVCRPAREPLASAGLTPLQFAPKEGLAFINGTQAQTATLGLLVHDAWRLWRSAIGAAAMSLEALQGTPTPLDPRIHEARPHPGQRKAADLMRSLLMDSEIRESHREGDTRVQDAYSLRCTPQVLGAVADAIEFADRTVQIELNASTDNPLVFGDDILSGGNFHGQPVAQALDILAMTLTTLQAISERRVERLVNPDLSVGLPAFLTADPGLSSGFMMVQITAAALVAESRTLAMPASIGSIPTDANQEDFVPMGMAAAYKASRILENARRVVACEYCCALQGLEFLAPLEPGTGVADLRDRLRTMPDPVRPLEDDRPPSVDLERITRALADGLLEPSPAISA
jgi:histidine ammonia-lyase